MKCDYPRKSSMIFLENKVCPLQIRGYAMVVYGTVKPQAYRSRLVDGRLQRLLSTFGAVEIRGTKWCGKSWANPILENGKESTKKLILRLAGAPYQVEVGFGDVSPLGLEVVDVMPDARLAAGDAVLVAKPLPYAARGEGASQLWSLADIHEANGNLVSKNTAFDKQYLSGRYGADPYLTRVEEWV